MKEEYEKINVTIGKVLAQVSVSNSFPVVGDTVRISSVTQWAKNYAFELNTGKGKNSSSGVPVLQKAEGSVAVMSAGDLEQTFSASNSISSIYVTKYLYSMTAKEEPYFSVHCNKEIIRTDGEQTRIIITGENGYDLSREHSVVIKIFRENEEEVPQLALFEVNTGLLENGQKCLYVDFSIDARGIYDIEVTLLDVLTGQAFTKRLNKLVTVTPALAPREKAVELIIPTGDEQASWYPMIDLSIYAPGTTIVLRDDPELPEGYKRRLMIKNAKGTFENPIIITIDQDTPYHIPFVSYNGININHCEHIVVDGRGYRNIKKGIHVHPYKNEWGETAIIAPDGTTETEFFELELSDTMFAGFSCKTEALPNKPEYWYGNWEYNRLLIHHCYIHDTYGEGAYLGYFNSSEITGVNSAGEEVTYRPHSMENTRLYRNDWINNGYDAIQLNNARNTEICYNRIENAGWRNEADQASCMSLSLQGKIYNNTLRRFCGPGIQVAPFGELDIFNNVITGTQDGNAALLFLFDSNIPEHSVEGEVNRSIPIYVHNNVLIGRKECILARNTVQFQNVFIDDNLLLYKTSLFGGQTEQTLGVWQSQMKCNEVRQYSEIDFTDLDRLKLADSLNGDFRISYNSPLADSGYGLRFNFDFNGYKSWYEDTSPVGPYQGVYKNPDYVEVPLTLHRLIINNGEATTEKEVLTLFFDFTGKAFQYRIGEEASLSGVEWKDLSSQNTYTLTSGYGTKRLYGQVKGIRSETEIVFADIEYVYIPTILTGLIINEGEENTIFDKLRVEIQYELQRPEFYMISETDSFTDAEWKVFDDVVDYFISGDSRTVTLFVKVKKGEFESAIVSDSIEYISTIRYKEIELRIPLSELSGGIQNIEVSIPELKYGKRFAFSWTMDDTLIYVYSRMFNYINKKWVDNSKLFHDGMPRTTGIMPLRFLCYTDGCGRDIRFGLNSGFISHLNGKTPVLEYSYTGSQYFHLKEMQKFIDFGNGIQNHGAGGYNDQGAPVAIQICNEEVWNKLGFIPFLLLFPGEEDQAAFAAGGLANPDVYQMSTGIKDRTIGLNSLTDEFFRNKRSLMNRLTYDTYNYDKLKEKVDYAYAQNNAHLMNLGGHNVLIGDSKFIDWELSVRPFLDYVHDTYGKGGNDSVWFAPLEEIFEYIFVRHFSTISIERDSLNLIVRAKIAEMQNFRQKDFTLRLTGSDLSKVKTIEANAPVYGLTHMIQIDGSLLLNLNYNSQLDVLANKYVTSFENSPSQDSMEDARYMVSRLRKELSTPYLDRINKLDVPFGLDSISLNNGSTETYKREITVTIVYKGFVTPLFYRLSEEPEFVGKGWSNFTSAIPYTLSEGYGLKTLYCQIKAPDGTISESCSTTISLLEQGARKLAISIGWSGSEIASPFYLYENGVTKVSLGGTPTRKIFWNTEEEAGTVFVKNAQGMMYIASYKGAVSGDNSNVYPDSTMERNIAQSGNGTGYKELFINLPSGVYKVRPFASTIYTRDIPTALRYFFVTDSGTEFESVTPFTLPEGGIINNVNNWMELTVTIPDTGCSLKWGLESPGQFIVAPLNMIEIEEVKNSNP